MFGLAFAIKIQHYQHHGGEEALEHYEPLEYKEKHHIPILKHEFKQSKEGYQYR